MSISLNVLLRGWIDRIVLKNSSLLGDEFQMSDFLPVEEMECTRGNSYVLPKQMICAVCQIEVLPPRAHEGHICQECRAEVRRGIITKDYSEIKPMSKPFHIKTPFGNRTVQISKGCGGCQSFYYDIYLTCEVYHILPNVLAIIVLSYVYGNGYLDTSTRGLC